MRAATHLLRFQGVNFDATINDTNDLSTVRGSSLALEAAGGFVEQALRKVAADVVKKTAGASQGAYTFTGDADKALSAAREALKQTTRPPLQHLTFMVDAVEVAGGDKETAMQHAEARNLSAQYRNWSFGMLPAFDASVLEYDRWEGTRPVEEIVKVPRDKMRELDVEADKGFATPGKDCDLVPMSASVGARREYGRQNRQSFYKDFSGANLNPTDMKFTDSFEGIVGHSQHLGLPVSLANKMAVVHVDGNGFGDLVKALGASKFEGFLRDYHTTLLTKILEWFRTGDERFRIKIKGKYACRFETLLWGGDDIDLVMPSWLAFAFAEGFFRQSRQWDFGGKKVTHAMGIIICDRKTPIRLARRLAHESVDRAKAATEAAAKHHKEKTGETLSNRADCVTFDIFESSAAPDDGLGVHRARFYGPYLAGATGNLDGQLAFPAESLGEIRALIAQFKTGKGGPKLPRSKLYAVMAEIRRKSSTGPMALTTDDIGEYFRRVTGAAEEGLKLNFPRLAAVPARPLLLDFVLATQLWDYADPFDGDLQPF